MIVTVTPNPALDVTGHVGRVATLEGGLPDGIAVAGAALHGVGVPACVGTGRAAAERLARAVVSIG